ncbi:MAG TPA: hypothetical protein VMV51_11370 [Gemmatimonadaceae bacterium]|nr:hypothetical protein [Gemmatimonadaceae bacterium]
MNARCRFHRWMAAAPAALLFVAAPASGQQAVSFPRQDGHTVPATVYAPAVATCLGVAILSPGAGGSEKGLAYLGKAMSAQGYLAVVVGHQESGLRALRQHMRGRGLQGGLAALITDASAYEGRFMDIAAAKQWADTRCTGRESILLGHSMGAATVMIAAGAANKLGVRGSTRFDVYVALSPQGVSTIFPEHAWQGITSPVLMMTGTRDEELGGLSWKTRTQPFDDMPAGCKWLGVVDNATHGDFGGNGTTPGVKAIVARTVRAFLSGVRGHDCGAPPSEPGITLRAK